LRAWAITRHPTPISPLAESACSVILTSVILP